MGRKRGSSGNYFPRISQGQNCSGLSSVRWEWRNEGKIKKFYYVASRYCIGNKGKEKLPRRWLLLLFISIFKHFILSPQHGLRPKHLEIRISLWNTFRKIYFTLCLKKSSRHWSESKALLSNAVRILVHRIHVKGSMTVLLLTL